VQLYIQEYPYIKTRDEWGKLGSDIGFVKDTHDMKLHILQFESAKFIQARTTIGIMATNGAHHIS
jgi:hypothetical protein